jgi:predicted glycosyltransferase involved in capsule biosynthesis
VVDDWMLLSKAAGTVMGFFAQYGENRARFIEMRHFYGAIHEKTDFRRFFGMLKIQASNYQALYARNDWHSRTRQGGKRLLRQSCCSRIH